MNDNSGYDLPVVAACQSRKAIAIQGDKPGRRVEAYQSGNVINEVSGRRRWMPTPGLGLAERLAAKTGVLIHKLIQATICINAAVWCARSAPHFLRHLHLPVVWCSMFSENQAGYTRLLWPTAVSKRQGVEETEIQSSRLPFKSTIESHPHVPRATC